MTVQEEKNSLNQFALKIYRYLMSHEWLLAIFLTIAVVAIGSALGIENNQIIALNSYKLAHYSLEPANKLSFLANWDGARYISIVLHGYSSSFVTGFFPLYPILIFIFHQIISSPLMSALVVSWLFLIGAIYYYLKIVKLYFNLNSNIEALKATLLFVLFPSGVYLIAAYSESAFALLALAAIYYAMQDRYINAGLMAMLAAVTRIDGVFILLLVALILFEQKQKIKNIVLTSFIGSLGLISYMVFLFFTRHNPLEFIKAQQTHHWLQSTILSKLASFGWVDWSLFLVVLWTSIYWWKRKKSFSIYSMLFLLIPIVGGQFGGYPRYILMLFPLQFMLFAYVKEKKFVYQILLVLFSVTWTYTLLQFAAGYIIS